MTERDVLFLDCNMCSDRIWFPAQIRLGKTSDQQDSPTGISQTYIVCSFCEQASAYYLDEFHQGALQKPDQGQHPDDKVLFVCEFECVPANCTIGARVHILADADTGPGEIYRRVLHGLSREAPMGERCFFVHPYCLNGHPVVDALKIPFPRIGKTTEISWGRSTVAPKPC